MNDRYTEQGVTHQWTLKTPVTSLYGLPVVPASLMPVGRLMTLRNVRGEELTLRGETHGDRIVFHHVEGRGYEIGAWVAIVPNWVTRLRESFMEAGK